METSQSLHEHSVQFFASKTEEEFLYYLLSAVNNKDARSSVLLAEVREAVADRLEGMQ
jgi:hypothetical protein